MNKTIWYVLGGVALVGILGFAYYAISPLFINIKVDEALPGQETEESSTTGAHSEDVKTEVSSTQSTAAPVVGTPAHPASGFVRVIEVEEKTYVRYENYQTINGPDLYVYLAKDIEAKEFIDLGALKATEGNINYEIPAGVEVSEYPYVLTWCKQFGVLFNHVDLTPII